MIVPMKKVFIASHKDDRDALVAALGALGVLHIVPVDPKAAVAEERTVAAIDHARRALQILEAHKHDTDGESETLDPSPADAVEEILRIQREQSERQNRLLTLANKVRDLDMWGDARLEQFDVLETAGLHVTLVCTTPDLLATIDAEIVQPISDATKKQVFAAILRRDDNREFPEDVEVIERPEVDRPTLQSQAKEIEAGLEHDATELTALVPMRTAITEYLTDLQARAEHTIADRSATDSEMLLALQGWVPANVADTLAGNLTTQGLDVAVQCFDPTDDDTPPTLIKFPKWVKPIKGLFDILGTVSGYREFDVSLAFMIALPVFAAILIGDGGYGLLLTIGLALAYPKLSGKMGKEFLQLMMVVGVTTTIWGFLANSFFGAPLPFYPWAKPLIPVNMSEPSMNFMMKLSFIIGATHLSLAKLWQVIRLAPSLKALSALGWGLIIWGMLGVIQMFLFSTPLPGTPWFWMLIVGSVMAILFDHPSKNIAKMIGLGVANFPLALLSAFSDVFSYVRLMAVGLASAVLAANFNEMALGIDFWPATVLILILGHSLNLALCMIALFAHGVRLNMLEFSNNLGMQWTGQDYRPFVHLPHKEME
jgi:V/A-type H+/Na+-transporting ATPase subunit I